MHHCNNSVVTIARLDTATTLLEGSTAPGILTAKTLQNVLLSSRNRSRNDEVKPIEEIMSPYGRMQRQDRVRRYKNRPKDSEHLHTYLRPIRDVARRKRCRKLDPMPALILRYHTPIDKPISNQISGGNSELEVPDKVHIEQLRSGLNQNKSKQQQDAERLQREIQWIHGHFPVLKLANAKCSRSLRQELFRTAVIHVLTNFTLRRALLTWYQKLLDAQRKERLQLSASRQLIAMLRKRSLERAASRFNAWRQWVFESQAQENMAAAITLQRFSKFLKFRREERESAEQQASLLQALDKVRRSAKTIQRAYLKYRQHLQHCRDEYAARQIQRIAKRRRDYNEFIKRRNAAAILQRSYRAYLNRRSRKRARTIAQLLDRSREQQARRIQTAWCGYKEWRDKVLVGIVHKLVDQVELSAAVLTIQRHLRKFQCRFRFKKKKEDSAIRIQKCWQARRRRETSRAKRRMVLMQQNLAASCLQRTFRRHKVERKVRGVLRKSTRPLYLRARHFSDSFREQFRLPIVKSATVVIQTTWRHHFAYVKEKQRRMAARKTIRRYLKHGIVTSKWRTTAMNLRHRRDAAARTLQHWIRRLRSRSSHRIPSVVNIAEQISATTTIQLWYRRRRYDLWRFLLDRFLVQELPRCIEAVNRIIRCWKGYCARKQENLVRANVLADLIEQQRQSESENAADRVIQRMAKRQLDKRKGQILLHQYRILLRQDMKRRQQRAIVHKYLQEKSQLRKKKQEAQAATLAARQSISINSMESSQTQGLSLDSYTSEASAFPLDENPNNNEILTTDNPVQYWSDEYQRAYLYDPVTGVSTWL